MPNATSQEKMKKVGELWKKYKAGIYEMKTEAKQEQQPPKAEPKKDIEFIEIAKPKPKPKPKPEQPTTGYVISDVIYSDDMNTKEKYDYMKKKGITKNMVLKYIENITSTPVGRTMTNKDTLNFLQRYAGVCTDNDEETIRRLINNLKEIGKLKMRKAEKLNNLLKAVDESGFLTTSEELGVVHIALSNVNLFISNLLKIKKTCPDEVKKLKSEINKFKNNEYGWSKAIMKKVNMSLIDKIITKL
jgi:hypothetical protein